MVSNGNSFMKKVIYGSFITKKVENIRIKNKITATIRFNNIVAPLRSNLIDY